MSETAWGSSADRANYLPIQRFGRICAGLFSLVIIAIIAFFVIDEANARFEEKANILIAINANNEIWIDRRRVDIRSVRPNIERLHAENPQGSVVIQADKESKTETLIKVMDASRSAGVFNVAIAAQEQ